MPRTNRTRDRQIPSSEPEYLPTPDEIARATAEIREEWPDYIRARRQHPHVPPVCYDKVYSVNYADSTMHDRR